jgi:hypothetical protein
MSLQSPDGEDLEAFTERLDRALRRVADHYAASRIIVSHMRHRVSSCPTVLPDGYSAAFISV